MGLLNIRVFASSVLGVWAALRLKTKGFEVELILLKKDVETLRPIRISRQLLSPVIAQLSKLGIPVSHILEAPVLRGWVSPSGEDFEKLWVTPQQEERWIDPARLKESLVRAAELEGIPIKEVDSFATPPWNNPLNKQVDSQQNNSKNDSWNPLGYLGVYEAEAREISHWSKAFQTQVNSISYDVTEILFPRGMDSSLQKILFFEFEGVKGSLENLNRQKSVLTLISRSRILLDRVLEDLRTKLCEKQSAQLRALFALNPHIFRRDYKSLLGESGLYLPQFCLLGSGFGGLQPLMNTQVREGFKQIARLEELMEQSTKTGAMDPTRIGEVWYQSERRGFVRLLSWQQHWEASLWSRMRQSWALRVQQYLPYRLRDLLHSPL